MKPTILKMLLSGSLVSALLLTAGCNRDREEAQETSPKVADPREAETEGVERDMEATGRDVEQGLEETGQDIEQGVEDTGQEIEQGLDGTEDRIQGTGEDMRGAADSTYIK